MEIERRYDMSIANMSMIVKSGSHRKKKARRRNCGREKSCETVIIGKREKCVPQ